MGLHEARVEDGVLGCDDADAACGFLHDDGEDEARVDAARGGDLLDAGFHLGDFGAGVVGDAPLRAGVFHLGLVVGEPGVVVVSRGKCVEGVSMLTYMVSKSIHWAMLGQPWAEDPSPV